MFYLKYRPQTIAQLDNVRIKETLGKALLNNDFGHAYLLLGTRGSGKTTTARLISKIVNCTKRKKGEEPCNECNSCVSITEGRSLDVIEIDAASNTGVEDIRELRERVKLAPVSSKFKVYIIDEVHMLSTSAFNALLKTLEEPPEHVIFVLATTDPQKLPATIISRCLVYDFGRASKEEVVSSLERKVKAEKLDVEDGVLKAISDKADGSFRDADKILEQLTMQSKKLTLELVLGMQGGGKVESCAKEVLLKLSGKDSKGALLVIEKFVSENGPVKQLMAELVTYLKSLLLKRNGIEIENDDFSLTTEEISQLIMKLIEANSMMRESPIAQLPLELAVAEFCQTKDLRGSNSRPVESMPQRQMTSKFQDIVQKTNDPTPTISKISEIQSQPKGASDASVDEVNSKWAEILNAIKPYNHNLSALLRSSRPKKLEKDFLTIEAYYKFHMDKLSEIKNREIVEKVISDLLGQTIKVKFELSESR